MRSCIVSLRFSFTGFCTAMCLVWFLTDSSVKLLLVQAPVCNVPVSVFHFLVLASSVAVSALHWLGSKRAQFAVCRVNLLKSVLEHPGSVCQVVPVPTQPSNILAIPVTGEELVS